MEASEYFELLTNRNLLIIVDDPALIPFVRQHGFNAIHFDDFEFLSGDSTPAARSLPTHPAETATAAVVPAAAAAST